MGTTQFPFQQGDTAAQVRVFAGERVWLEDAALEQLRITARLAHIRAAVGLPDLHPGRGYPVGAAFFSVNHFYPALVGGDIGCGMGLWRTDLRAHSASASKFEKQLGNIDGRLPDALMDDALGRANHATASATSLGCTSLPCGLRSASLARAWSSLMPVFATMLATASRTMSVSVAPGVP